MNIAIIHHLPSPDGVTRVIADTSRGLTAAGIAHVILVGSPPDAAAADLPIRVVPGLEDDSGMANPNAGELAANLRAAASETLAHLPDIWHFHNHSLGNHPQITEVIALLARENERLILQIDDLAEDGGPGNQQHSAGCPQFFPYSSRIHYLFRNPLDLQLFIAAGLPPENTSILTNPITHSSSNTHSQSSPAHPTSPSPLLFAPIRGIRRNNLGELIFLSALAPTGTRMAVSRAPLNPEELPVHDTWRKFAREHRLPIEFNVVDHYTPAANASSSLNSWLAHATHFVTTSVTAGARQTLLEAVTLGKPVIGRNVPHVPTEHAHCGVRHRPLYDHLLIPVEWINLPVLRDYLITTLERTHRACHRRLPGRAAEDTLATLVHEGWLDFGNLPEPLQQGAIERLAEKSNQPVPLVSIHGNKQSASDWLAAVIELRATPGEPAHLTPATCQNELASIYTLLATQPASPVRLLSPTAILDSRLSPQSFHFLLSPTLKSTRVKHHRAVICSIYGTLLIAPDSTIIPDPAADPTLRDILQSFGHEPPESPSTELHAAVLRHHAATATPFPEIDLRALWREVLSLEPGTDTTQLVLAIETAWHPAKPMPGADKTIRNLAAYGISLGLLANAQSHTLHSLGGISDLFAPELTILSYQHGAAKPDPELFQILTDRLAGRRITPAESLFIGNDPLQDIVPAAAAGFKTALFTGHPASIRPGKCSPDFIIRHWSELANPGSLNMHDE